MPQKKDLKAKGPENTQSQLATEEELENTGQKRKTRSSSARDPVQKKVRLENPVSLVVAPADSPPIVEQNDLATPAKRPRRAAAVSAKAKSTQTSATPSSQRVGTRLTRARISKSSTNKEAQENLPDRNEVEEGGSGTPIQATSLSREDNEDDTNPSIQLQTPEDKSVEHASALSTTNDTFPAKFREEDVADPKAKHATSSPFRRKRRKVPEDQDTAPSTSVLLPSSSKKRGRKTSVEKDTHRMEAPIIPGTGLSSVLSTRGKRKAQDARLTGGPETSEEPTRQISTSTKKGGQRRKLRDVIQTKDDEELNSISPPTQKRTRKDATIVEELTDLSKKVPGKLTSDVKWKIDTTSSQKMVIEQDEKSMVSAERPRIWTQEREHLLAMLPELGGSRCVNGLTWVMYETPMLLLDHNNTFMEIDWKDRQANIFDIVTTRSFSCSVPEVSDILHSDGLYYIHPDEEESKQTPQNQNKGGSNVQSKPPTIARNKATLVDCGSKQDNTSLTTSNPSAATAETSKTQQKSVPTYRVISAAYTMEQEQTVKREEPSYRFVNVPTIDAEAVADRIMDDASRLLEVETNPGVAAVDADSMEIIHSPETPTALPLPDEPCDVGYSQSPTNISISVEPSLEQVATPMPKPEPPAPSNPLVSYIPSAIPEELAAIIDAYVSGSPIILLISNERLVADWSIALPQEFGVVAMGYFRILDIEEERLPADEQVSVKKRTTSMLTGRVRWRFTLQWAQGGEKHVFPESKAASLQHPWWSPLPHNPDNRESSKPSVSSTSASQGEQEEQVKLMTKYQIARREHPNWEFRHYPYDNIYHGLIPKHLLAPFGPEHSDDFFPLGWFCEHCGRLNFQAAMRQRQCKSSFCKDSSPPYAYSVDLLYLRDPHDRHVVFLPNTTHPDYIQTQREESPAGIITFSYSSQDGQTPFLKHVFTSNLSEHQVEATDLLQAIQSNVELVRTTDISDPYFYYSTKDKKLHGDRNSPEAKWLDVPECVNESRAFMSARLREFGKLKHEQLPIGAVTIVSWITAGIRPTPVPINAKKHPVSVLCMGCDVVLNIALPAGVAKNKSGAAPDEQAVGSKTDDNAEEVEYPDPSLGWAGDDPESMALVQEQTQGSSRKGPRNIKIGKKVSKDIFTLTLVHGDMVVFFGETFECSIKRGGTSLLIIATQK